jgi:hypothetical protein
VTPLQIVALGVRLVALIWLLYTLNNLHHVFMYLDMEMYRGVSRPLVWIFSGLQLAGCALLWFFPRSIAARLLPSRDAQQPASSPQLVEWQTIGVILIGLWAMVDAIKNALYWAGVLFWVQGSFGDFSPEWKASVILTLVEFPIALWLLLGAKGIAAALFRLRTAGLKD